MNLKVLKDFKKFKEGQVIKDDGSEKFFKFGNKLIDLGVVEEIESTPKEVKVELSKKLTPKQILKEASKEEEIENYEEGKINWLEEDTFLDTWDKVKGHLKQLLGNNETYDYEEEIEPFKRIFIAHSEDTIKTKPQLIEKVQKKIPLIREVIGIKTDKKTKKREKTFKYLMFDDKYDKRYDGYQRDCLALDFWIYRGITKVGKEYYILSHTQLPNEVCTFKGMNVEMDDFAEFSRSMKIKSLSRIFFMKEFEPSVKIISKEQLVTFTKEREITEEKWFDFMGYHEWGTINVFPKETQYLKSSVLLSGKKEDYPNHLGIIGIQGTKKSSGYIEATAFKFSETPKIIEGGNSRLKGLEPSFKEKPASIGYLASAERMGFVDEIGKMIDFERNKHQSNITNILGDLNFLLDHKKRTVSSGNDNECDVQASAKFMFVTNPCANLSNIYQHVGVIDPTFMSRIMWWVQDDAEKEFVLSKNGIKKLPPTPKQAQSSSFNEEKRKKYKGLDICWGDICNIDREEFLTLFDTCYSFTCDINEDEVNRLVEGSVMMAKDTMKGVWRPRAPHHVYLLIDGLVKHRCLFKDYDPTFTPKPEDYTLADEILTRMVQSWDTDLSQRGDD